MERNVKFTSQRISKAPTAASPRPRAAEPQDQEQQQQQQKQEQEQSLMMMAGDIDSQLRAEREQAIHRIASSILDLKAILEEMHRMTLEQGSMLDRIDTHIQETAVFTRRAQQHVEERHETQKDFFSRKCVLLGLILAVLVTFLYLLQR